LNKLLAKLDAEESKQNNTTSYVPNQPISLSKSKQISLSHNHDLINLLTH